eukprot:3341742-Pyramimonas_sp.AAC.1
MLATGSRCAPVTLEAQVCYVRAHAPPAPTVPRAPAAPGAPATGKQYGPQVPGALAQGVQDFEQP